jgi:hypothetical protein
MESLNVAQVNGVDARALQFGIGDGSLQVRTE